jgi:electron transfer flavoprotein alpha subunit
MAVLVIADHDNSAIRPATLNTVSAAAKLGDVTVLVAGASCKGAADAAAKIAGVAKVLLADNAAFAHGLAENLAPLVVKLAAGYSHVLASSTTFGKNLMPRVAALLDVAQISDIVAVKDADTFVRPIYAGNAMATVQSKDKIKIVTVRGTAFPAAAAEGGSASVETVSEGSDAGLSKFVREEVQRSERPELTSAKIIVSGGRGMGSGERFEDLEDLVLGLHGRRQAGRRSRRIARRGRRRLRAE